MKPNVIVLGISLGALLIAGCSSSQPPAAKPAPKTAPAVVTRPAPTPAAETPPAPPPPIAPEVAAVVEQLTEPESGGLQHEKVEATGFPQAMASLQMGAPAPDMNQPVNYGSQPPTRGLTADGATAELVERDWTGIVLVPINAEFAKAYTSLVRLTSIEAHPLTDGRVRTWVRVRNVVSTTANVGVACTFLIKERGEATSPRFYSLQIPPHEYRDVFFVSPVGQLVNYTVLVKPGN